MIRISIFPIICFWSLRVSAGSLQFDFEDFLKIDLYLGTPAQGPFEFDLPVEIRNSQTAMPTLFNENYGGLFNPNKSKTFKEIKTSEYDCIGTDRVQLPNGKSLSGIKMNVLSHNGELAWASLRHGTLRKPSFIDQLLEGLGGDRSVVLAFGKFDGYSHNGTAIFGDANSQLCAEWTHYPSRPAGRFQMTFNITELVSFPKTAKFQSAIPSRQIGKFHRAGQIAAVFHRGDLHFDSETYAVAVKELKVDSRGLIQCDIDANITVSAGELEWTLQPNSYIRKSRKYEGRCEFDVSESKDGVISLPLFLLEKRCLAYRFDSEGISLNEI